MQLIASLFRIFLPLVVGDEALTYGDAGPAELPDLVNEKLLTVERGDVVRAADRLALHHDVRHGAAASHLAEACLQLRPQWVLVQLDHVRRGVDLVLLQQDAFGPLRELAVRLGEDDDCVGRHISMEELSETFVGLKFVATHLETS